MVDWPISTKAVLGFPASLSHQHCSSCPVMPHGSAQCSCSSVPCFGTLAQTIPCEFPGDSGEPLWLLALASLPRPIWPGQVCRGGISPPYFYTRLVPSGSKNAISRNLRFLQEPASGKFCRKLDLANFAKPTSPPGPPASCPGWPQGPGQGSCRNLDFGRGIAPPPIYIQSWVLPVPKTQSAGT